MKKGFLKQFIPPALTLFVLIGSLWVVSCEEDYYYDDIEPDFLGASIYDYLKADSNFVYFTKLIDDVNYTPVLAKTGSKTLFVVRDSAFEEFFKSNPWGVSRYEDFSLAQKKLLLNFSMINNAFLIETFANYYNGSLQKGTALRRQTAISVFDSIPFEKGDMLPKGKFWDEYRTNGIYLLKDESDWPIVHFLPGPLAKAGISDSDFKLLAGVERSNDDVHIFNIKVIERDITCKNGYIHVLENVMIPPVNMAEHLRQNPNTSIFSELLDRFSAPYYIEHITDEYNENHPNNKIDSIFIKSYFTSINSNGASRYPNGNEIKAEFQLPFDPGSNSYGNYTDFGAILCPTDNAMSTYFESGSGVILKERYGSWKNVPDDIVMLLLRRHLRTSFLETVPAQFGKMNDSENSKIPVTINDVKGSYIGLNGVVYLTDKVYSPDDYISVYGPLLFSEKTKVFNWAVRQNDFRLYLNSIISRYSFFVPVDEFFKNYIDPVAYAKDIKVALKYWYNTKEQTVNATVFKLNSETGEIGDSISVITSTDFIKGRLLDLLDSHIVIGGVETGSSYYFTKNGNLLKISGSGNDLKVQGGSDIKNNIQINVIPNGVYNQENGKTYFIDKPIQTPLRSVYKVLSETPEFSKFYELLNGFLGTSTEIFVKKTNYFGIDYNIKFFNTFNYTVYVPTNEAIQTAIDSGLVSDWVKINALTDPIAKDNEIQKLERFLRYHFQDNSVLINGQPFNALYQTATIKTNDVETQFRTYKDKYYRLKINGDGNSISLSTENYGAASVVKDNGLFNILARDYIFNDSPLAFKEADGTGVANGKDFSTSSITTSSTAVIHQIDNVLRFE